MLRASYDPSRFLRNLLTLRFPWVSKKWNVQSLVAKLTSSWIFFMSAVGVKYLMVWTTRGPSIFCSWPFVPLFEI